MLSIRDATLTDLNRMKKIKVEVMKSLGFVRKWCGGVVLGVVHK